MISPGIRSQTIKLRPDGNYEATLRAKLFRIAQYSLKNSAYRSLPNRRITLSRIRITLSAMSIAAQGSF
jgi:hypothetical protein